MIFEATIQRFEYTHELAWNVMKDFLLANGTTPIYASRDATRGAFKIELIQDGDVWMDMITSRNKTSHTYHEELAKKIFLAIVEKYYPAFKAFETKMSRIQDGREQNNLL